MTAGFQSALPRHLIDAYAVTRYCFNAVGGEVTLRIGMRSEPLAALHAAHGVSCSAYLTAWNPFSEALAPEINEARQREMESLVAARGHPMIRGEGRSPDGQWRESSVLVLGIAEPEACALGRQFGQNAIVVIGADALPRLQLLR